MKFILFAAYFVLSVTLFSNSAFASDELSCDEIEEAIIVLSLTLDELEDGDLAGDDELFDMRLGIVAETAREFAEIEDNDMLIHYSEIMLDSWDDEDAESFLESGQAMIEYYHDLFDRDC